MLLSLTEKEKAIFMQVYQERTISRALLSKSSSLKSASLYRSVDSLLKCGYLLSQDNAPASLSTPGRPSDLLSLNPQIGHSLALSIWRNSCHIAIMDFSGATLCEEEFSFFEIPNASVFCNRLHHTVEQLQKSSGISSPLLGISIANVGLLDKTGEKIVKLTHNQHLFVQDLRLPKTLREWYDVPIIIHNMITCASVGYHTSHPYAANMSYIFVDDGIASHTIIHGKPLQTKHPTINGLGHMTVSLDGKKCECGAYGCLETYCSAYSIIKDIRSMMKLGIETRLRGEIEDISFKDICAACQNGDLLCQNVIRQAAAIFCVGLNNYVKLLPVDTLVFSGIVINEAPAFFRHIQEVMARQGWVGTLHRDRHIQKSVSLGCHTLLLNHILSIV